MKCLDINHVIQESDISIKLVKHFDNLIVYKKISIIVLKWVPSLTILKNLWFMQPIKKTAKLKNQTIDQLANEEITKLAITKFIENS